jgi:4-hydroxy-tetrahydrodipicolinate synthase
MFVEASPGPVKFAASLLGLCEPDTRLPLIPVMDSTKATVREALIHAGLLN